MTEQDKQDETELKKCTRIRVFVPRDCVPWVRSTLDALDERSRPTNVRVGAFGKYAAVRYETPCDENYIPLRDAGAKPAAETPPPCVCVETWCFLGDSGEEPDKTIEKIVNHLKNRHPWKHPVIEVSDVKVLQAKELTHGIVSSEAPDPKNEVESGEDPGGSGNDCETHEREGC